MNGDGFFEVHAKLTQKKVAARKVTAPTGAGGAEPMSVTQLTSVIEQAIKGGVPASVAVRGEMSNCSYHRASGHLYFTLKDATACIDCVMFKDSASRLKFTCSDGMDLVATGRVGIYATRGRYQLYASTLQPVGQGALELAFRQLRAKLATEGLFDAERKKPIPLFPSRIVLMTSQSTAALQDMLKVLRRFSWLKVMVYHVPVQGEGSGEKIADALGHLNRHAAQIGGVDVILLARGGGSLEDLWAFNEESVARAIAASGIPVVTGIGHEVDCSIADLVADHHAHTPTEAAQTVTAHWQHARDHIDLLAVRLRRAIRQTVVDARQRLTAVERHEHFRRPTDRIQSLRQLLDDRQRSMTLAMTRRLRIRQKEIFELEGRLAFAANERVRTAQARFSKVVAGLQESHPRHLVNLARQRLDSLAARLHASMRQVLQSTIARVDAGDRQLRAMGPQQVLQRGYSITRMKKNGTILRNAAQVKEGDRLVTQFADGEAESIVQDAKQLPLFE